MKSGWLVYWIGKYSFRVRRYYGFNCHGRYTWGLFQFQNDCRKSFFELNHIHIKDNKDAK